MTQNDCLVDPLDGKSMTQLRGTFAVCKLSSTPAVQTRGKILAWTNLASIVGDFEKEA